MSATETEFQESEPEFIPTRNYTDNTERNMWWYIKMCTQDRKSYLIRPVEPINKERFRTRRDEFGYECNRQNYWKQALRARIGNSYDLGSLSKLTNTYLLVGGEIEAENFCKTVEGDVPELQIINCSISGCRTVGCMCVGNTHGLVVPESIYDPELKEIREHLPDSIKVNRLDDKLSALGNIVACNDRVAIIHPDLNQESAEIIEDTLQVEVFRYIIANNPLVGSYCVLNNHGGLVHVDMDNNSLEDLSSLLDLPLVVGTVNSGNKIISSGLIANDTISYAGMKTTGKEFTSIETAFRLKRR